jgi:serine/threonine-protein kinase
VRLPPERWPELERIVDRALDVAPAERASLVAACCAGDAALRDAALAWLRGCERADGVLDAPVAELTGGHPAFDPTGDDGTGDDGTGTGDGGAPVLPADGVVGAWRLVREIGRGGMGVVYLAERADRELPMRVALKLMRRGAALDPLGVRRFREERRILATLVHPGIARLVDGGLTADEQPWFAMEHVDGEPVDRWCDRRALGVEERLRLFCRVCDAVHHAHQRLVVHRDLKPSNILVTGAGEPKLLDFGVAKLLDLGEGTDAAEPLTRVGQRPMTPAYASPEQLRGDPVSTASDLYSLGVLLYLLLSGHLPFAAGTAPDALARRIVTGGAERPSAAARRTRPAGGEDDETLPTRVARARGTTPARLHRRLRGDLDTIVARAMHPEPERRYATADALADDVRRHLAGRPVLARPDTVAYRLRKLVGRQPLAVASSIGAVVTLLGFTTLTALQARRLAAERDRAEEVTEFLAGLLASTDPYQPGGPAPSVRALLDRGAARVHTDLRDRPDVHARLLAAMAPAYFGLGEWERARRLMEEAIALQRTMLDPDDPQLATSLGYLAQVRLTQGDAAPAESLYRAALVIRRARPRAPDGPDSTRLLSGLGSSLQRQGRLAEAEAVLRDLLHVERARAPADSLGIAQVARNLAHVLRDRGAHAAAAPLYAETHRLHRAAFGDEHPETANSLVNLAAARMRLGDLAEAERLFRVALATKQRLLGRRHPDVAADEVGFAELLMKRGLLAEAESTLVVALATHRETLPPGHGQIAHDLMRLDEVRRARAAGARVVGRPIGGTAIGGTPIAER